MLHRDRRWIHAALACGLAAIICVALAWPRPPFEQPRASSPPTPIAEQAPAQASSRGGLPVASVPAKKPAPKVARKPAPKVARKPAPKIAAHPIRSSAPATKHQVRPPKKAVRTTTTGAASAKKARD